MAQDSGSQRRAAAAAVKAEASLAAKRDKRIKVIGGAVVALVVVGIVAAGYFGAKSATPHADATAAQPKGTLSESYGLPVKPIDDKKSTLVVYEDPQCPICKLFETAYGPTVTKFATDGLVNVVYQMATFIDDNLPQSNQASRRAVAAMGCAVDQEAGLAYHSLIYATQPENEGDGWSDEALRVLGGQAGISGDRLTAFQQCFDEGTYLGWADNLNQYFRDKGIGGTPTVELDGKVIPDSALASVATFTAYVEKNAK